MLLNAFSILDLFLVALRFLIGILVLWCSITSWRQDRGSRNPEVRQTVEDRGYLLYLLAVVLLGLNLISWPFFYLLLQSYVPEWPGVMCIFGVTRIGTGSMGASRFLPGLVQTLQVTKPLVVFLAGNWFVFYLINRRTSTAPLRGQVLITAAILGLSAIADGVVETAYVVIPKKEEFLSVGCCTGAFDVNREAWRFFPQDLFGEDAQAGLWTAYFAINIGMVVILFLYSNGWLHQVRRLHLALLAIGALVTLPISTLFLIEVVAPTILHLPYHHCPYDLLPNAPECMLGVACHLIGCFAIGWAAIAGWFARCPESQPFLQDFLRTILFLGLLGYSGSLVLIGTELLLV